MKSAFLSRLIADCTSEEVLLFLVSLDGKTFSDLEVSDEEIIFGYKPASKLEDIENCLNYASVLVDGRTQALKLADKPSSSDWFDLVPEKEIMRRHYVAIDDLRQALKRMSEKAKGYLLNILQNGQRTGVYVLAATGEKIASEYFDFFPTKIDLSLPKYYVELLGESINHGLYNLADEQFIEIEKYALSREKEGQIDLDLLSIFALLGQAYHHGLVVGVNQKKAMLYFRKSYHHKDEYDDGKTFIFMMDAFYLVKHERECGPKPLSKKILNHLDYLEDKDVVCDHYDDYIDYWTEYYNAPVKSK